MIPRNTIFRTAEEENSLFDIRGEPNFRQQTSTWISQDIELQYHGIEEAGIDLWNGTGIVPYDPVNPGFLPFNFSAEVVERLPLNYTFQDVKYLPEGGQHYVSVNNRDTLELRKLICTERSREAVERCEIPNEVDQTRFNWSEGTTQVPYSIVEDSLLAAGANQEYFVDVPICRFGRTLIGYPGEAVNFNSCPIVTDASMRTLRFAFDWSTGTFKYPGGLITLNTQDVVFQPPVQGNITTHKAFTVYVGPLETKPVNAAGYCVLGPDHSNVLIGNRTYGYTPVPLTYSDPSGEHRLVSESTQLVRVNRALDAPNFLAAIQNVAYSLADAFEKTGAFLAVPYFQIPFGKRTSRGRPPVLDIVAVDNGAAPPVPAYPGVFSFNPAGYGNPSWNLLGVNAALSVHDGIPNTVDVYMRWKQTVNQAYAGEGAAGARHAFYVQFPTAIPATFAADQTFFATFKKNAGAASVDAYFSGQTPAAADVNTWVPLTDLTVPTLAQYNIANAGQAANTRPPPAAEGSVIILYVKESRFVAANQDRLALPTNNMLENAAAVATNLAHITAAAENVSQHFFSATVFLKGQVPAESPYVRTGFNLQQHEPFYSFPSGLSCMPDVKSPFEDIPKFLPMLIQDSRTTFQRTTAELGRCVRLRQAGSLSAELVGHCVLGRYLQEDDVSGQSTKAISNINLPIPRLEHYSTTFATDEQPVLKIQLQFGLPDLLFLRKSRGFRCRERL